ncbi:MAG: xylose isomerase protein [Eubacterium sp.]|nr:xylose isomerase protein [Eubacterium sp.]
MGCYINPVHPDSEVRKTQIYRFKEHIRFARDFGCSIVATETGSLNADFSYTPHNHGEKAFEILLGSLSEMVEEAERFGVMVGIEGVSHYIMNNPEKIGRTLKRIDSNLLQVVFDPVNLLTVENYKRQEDIINQSFELFGDRMVAFHAKDFIIENNMMKVVQAGEGLFNYDLTLKRLNESKPCIDILMENARVEIMDRGIEFLRSKLIEKI